MIKVFTSADMYIFNRLSPNNPVFLISGHALYLAMFTDMILANEPPEIV